MDTLLFRLRNRHFFALDLAALAVIPSLALALRLDGLEELPRYAGALLAFTLIGLIVRMVVFHRAGLYYLSYDSWGKIVLIVVVTVTTATAINTLLFFILRFLPPCSSTSELLCTPVPMLPRSIPVIDGLLTLMAVGGTRLVKLSRGRAAQSTLIELDAQKLERCTDLAAIRFTHHHLEAGKLEGPGSALLRSFGRISRDVDAALHQESNYNQRLALSAVEDRLDGLSRELTHSSGDDYAVLFRPIATRWRQIVADHVHYLAKVVEARQEIDSPYVIGVPLTEQQEIFVGRADISARIEGLLLDRRRPPLLLYGQRRMGKTSLLNNLGRLLPSTIVPLFVDLQGPATKASDHAGFLYNVARGMAQSAERQRDLTLPVLSREMLVADPFTCFDEWLDEVEVTLEQNIALLALDEFEALDSVIARGYFDEEAVLGMLRHLIQHRPRVKVLLAGSHTPDELQRWASYLINVQVVHISYLKKEEARQLIERPVKDFALRYEPDASQRVLDLTRGHPFLVQLLCAEIVALKNEQALDVRRLARLADVEAAVLEALRHGRFFFADIQQNQVDAAGLALLRFLATQGEGTVVSQEALACRFPDDLDRILDLLMQRELIEPTDGGYCFQVELIRRWFAQQVK